MCRSLLFNGYRHGLMILTTPVRSESLDKYLRLDNRKKTKKSQLIFTNSLLAGCSPSAMLMVTPQVQRALLTYSRYQLRGDLNVGLAALYDSVNFGSRIEIEMAIGVPSSLFILILLSKAITPDET